MNIFISAHLYFPAKIGGPANTLYWLANALVRAGHNVSLVATHDSIDQDVPYNEWILLNGVNVFYSKEYNSRSSEYMEESKKAIQFADVVILNSVCFLPEFFLCKYALSLNKKVIWSPRGELSKRAINNSLKKKVYFHILRLLFGKRITLHVTSSAEKEDADRVFGVHTKKFIIPNYMEVPAQTIPSESATDYLLFLGRIAPIKSLDKIIKGLSLSHEFLKSNVRMKIVGGIEPKYQSYFNDLQILIQSLNLSAKIDFEGPLFKDDKLKIIRNARALLLLSESENFGNVVIEAFSQGTPVIASHGTPWNVLVRTHAGFWIDNSPEIIGKTIDRMLSMDIDFYHAMRANALKLSTDYDVDANISRWEEVFKSLVTAN